MGRKGGGGEGEARRRVGERAGQGGWVQGADLAHVYERWRGRVGGEGSGEGLEARAKPFSASPSSNTISVPLSFADAPRGAHGIVGGVHGRV